MASAKKAAGGSVAAFNRTVALASAFILIGLYASGKIDGLERKWDDLQYNARGMTEAKSPVFLVKIDDESLAQVGQYPWPRKVYVKLLDQLGALGVKTVAFDVLFLEKSPSAEGDRAFAEALKRSGRAVLACTFETTIRGTIVKWPIPEFRKAAAGLGFVNMPYQDKDAQIRAVATRLPALDGETEVTLPLLATRALAHFQGKPVEAYYDSVPDAILVNLRGERHEEQELQEGVIRKIDEYAFPSVSAVRILEGKLTDKEKAVIKGGLAFVGSTATGAFDAYPSPFSEKMPGVIIHMTTVDNIIAGDYFRSPSHLWTVPLILLAIALAYWLIHLKPLSGIMGAVGILAAWMGLNYWCFTHNYQLEFAPPAFALASVYIVLLGHTFYNEEKQKRFVRNTFSQYLSPAVVKMLVDDPSKVRLGGEKRDLSIFFLDIAHFTTISEKLTPEDLVKFLNVYLTDFTDIILRNGGTVDKYIGDCIMAFWNAPLDLKDHRKMACLSAVQCITAINKLNSTVDLPKDMPEMPAIRVGVNSGFANAGNFGSNQRFAYTIIGDEVNLASRLEGANKFFGSSIMASEASFKGVAEEAVVGRPLGRVKVVGKDIPILVYELMGEKGQIEEPKLRMLDAYNEGIEHYLARRFDKAAKSFEHGLTLVEKDGPSKKYLKICREFQAAPPDKDWDGVWELTSK